MSNLHPATAPHIRRAIARRERRNAIARVVLFSSSFAVCFLSLFPVSTIAKNHSGERSGAIAAASLMGLTFMAGASLICAAGAASEA